MFWFSVKSRIFMGESSSAVFHLRRSPTTFSEKGFCRLTDRCSTSFVIWKWTGSTQTCFFFLLRIWAACRCSQPTALCRLKLLFVRFSVKELIELNSGKEQGCDERDGWCVVGTTDKLRDIISTMIKKVVRAKKPGVVKRRALLLSCVRCINCYICTERCRLNSDPVAVTSTKIKTVWVVFPILFNFSWFHFIPVMKCKKYHFRTSLSPYITFSSLLSIKLLPWNDGLDLLEVVNRPWTVIVLPVADGCFSSLGLEK